MHVPPVISVVALLARAAALPQPPSRAGPSLAIHPEATQTQGHPALDPGALLALGYPPVGNGSPVGYAKPGGPWDEGALLPPAGIGRTCSLLGSLRVGDGQ